MPEFLYRSFAKRNLQMCKRSRQKRAAAAAPPQQNEILEESDPEVYYGIFSTPHVIRLLREKSITELWPIQSAAYNAIFHGHDLVVRAKAGSGKTYTYLICMVHECFRLSRYNELEPTLNLAPRIVIILRETNSCKQVHAKLTNLVESLLWGVKVALWTETHTLEEVLSPDGRHPDVAVSTLSCVLSYLKSGILESGHLKEFLEMLILDEVDAPLSPSYEEGLKSLLECVSKDCQCLLFSRTPSPDVDILRNLVKHNPRILTLTEKGSLKMKLFPYNVEQFYISCASMEDKLLCVERLLHRLMRPLIFTSSKDVCCRVKDFLKKCGMEGEVIDLDASCKEQLLEDLGAGRLRFLITVDDNQLTEDYYIKGKGHIRGNECLDLRFGMVKVHQVINFDIPQSVSGYFRRIVHAGKPNKIGKSHSLVCPTEMGIIQDVKSLLGDDPGEDSKIVTSHSRFYTRMGLYKGFMDYYGGECLSWLTPDHSDSITIQLPL